VLALGHERSHFFKEVPTAFEAFKLDKPQAWWIDFQAAFSEVGRSIMTGPGVPADRVKYFEDTLKKVLHDPAVVAELKKRDAPVTYATPTQLKKFVDDVLGGLTPEKKKQVRHVMLEKYY
jgi:hypothetical protein